MNVANDQSYLALSELVYKVESDHYCNEMKMRDFKVLFLRRAHNTEHPSRGCPHLVLISQQSRLKQCG